MVEALEKYLDFYRLFLEESKGPLYTRESRLKENYKDYVLSTRSQRTRNRLSPKFEPDVEGFISPNLDLRVVVENVLRENYKYVGTREIPLDYLDSTQRERDTLYNNINIIDDDFISGDSLLYTSSEVTNSRIYWEFVNKEGLEDTSNLNSWKYLYVPISLYRTLSSKVPSLFSWDVEQRLYKNSYPDYLYLIQATSDQWPSYYSLLTDSSTHPFLGPMIFTGRVVLQGDSSMLYEYSDVEGSYGPLYSLYMSPLRPTTLDYPLGVPKPGHLALEPCLLDRLGEYPIRGTEPYLGGFTGYRTTHLYNPLTTYYLYERLDSSTFLVEHQPHPYSRDYISMGMRVLDRTLGEVLFTEEGSDSISIEDTSTCSIYLQLSNRSCLNKRELGIIGSLYNNCNMIDDGFLIDGTPEECREEEDNPYVDLYRDCLVNDSNLISNSFSMEDCPSEFTTV